MDTYHFFLASGKESDRTNADQSKTYTDLGRAIAAFRKAVKDGHEYACLELLRDRAE